MKRKFERPIIGAFLTTREVAALEGVTALDVSHWCREDLIFPVQSVGGRWRIAPDYIVVPGARGKVYADQKRGRGRPLGAKNKRPYPLGVKRPRKPKTQSVSPSQ
ncbi:hypothetical protein UFOVP653_26 [uncultured Caudovirales phage]|uniref:Helix-turn-helix domain containing protein n=1 Tax=uncultured Caudovirales phage TaxID=2100421 RepID=A0A6J5NC35_9CAUD|nr:hypothetical protein UFOVP653_26 [uncultured Caudovirales phage]